MSYRELVDTECGDVTEFAARFQKLLSECPTMHPPWVLRSYAGHIAEEVAELVAGIDAEDPVAIADSLVDIVYVTKTMVVAMGLPWEDLWNAIHAANMTKVAIARGPRYDGQPEVVKPLGWCPPNITGILRKAGMPLPPAKKDDDDDDAR